MRWQLLVISHEIYAPKSFQNPALLRPKEPQPPDLGESKPRARNIFSVDALKIYGATY